MGAPENFTIGLCRHSARFDQTVMLGGQALCVNNALPPLSIVKAKRGAAPGFMYKAPSSDHSLLIVNWPFRVILMFEVRMLHFSKDQ